ncbi:unnamed protein product, partial [Prorocentrum cordatum]
AITEAVADCPFCVTVADPGEEDCPLVAVSDEFLRITGYGKAQVLGRNCRFLNEGCPADLHDIMALRQASKSGQRVTLLLTNRRRTGELFVNLLDLAGVTIAKDKISATEDIWYLIGVQADVTHLAEGELPKDHLAELELVAGAVRAGLEREVRQMALDSVQECRAENSSTWTGTSLENMDSSSNCGELVKRGVYRRVAAELMAPVDVWRAAPAVEERAQANASRTAGADGKTAAGAVGKAAAGADGKAAANTNGKAQLRTSKERAPPQGDFGVELQQGSAAAAADRRKFLRGAAARAVSECPEDKAPAAASKARLAQKRCFPFLCCRASQSPWGFPTLLRSPRLPRSSMTCPPFLRMIVLMAAMIGARLSPSTRAPRTAKAATPVAKGSQAWLPAQLVQSAQLSLAVVAILSVLLAPLLLVSLVTLPSLHISSHNMMMTISGTSQPTQLLNNSESYGPNWNLWLDLPSVDQQIMATVRPHIDSIHRGLQSKIDSLGSHVNTLSIDVEKHTADIANLRKQMEELRGELMVAKSTEKAPTAPPFFDRVEDPSVVVAMATKMVGIESVRASLSPFLAELGLDASSYTIKSTGPMPSRRYLVSFNGSVGLASKYVNKVLSNLRQNDDWRIFEPDDQPFDIFYNDEGLSEVGIAKHEAIPKLRYLQQIHLQSTLLAMQEVHADRVQLEQFVLQEHFKEMLKEAAREVRDMLFTLKAESDETAIIVARSVDGVPYAAWNASDCCVDVLCNTLDLVLGGGALFDAASVTLQAFLPKGSEEEDEASGGCARSADKIRVLGLRNTDLKIMTSVVNRSLRKVVEEVVPCSQRGFVVGRNFGYNVIELDGIGRLAAAHPCSDLCDPLLISFDYGQAFPSLSQEYLLMLMNKLGLPGPLMWFLSWLYLAIQGVVAHAGQLIPIYWLRSGIIQGCGLSGSLYALGAAPFLCALEDTLETPGYGIARACADEIGAVVYEARHLNVLYDVMAVTECLTGLKLKPLKCKIVPLKGEFTESLQIHTMSLVERLVPAWRAFEVASHVLYLGLLLGPAVTVDMQWLAPLQKLKLRARREAAYPAEINDRCVQAIAQELQVTDRMKGCIPINLEIPMTVMEWTGFMFFDDIAWDFFSLPSYPDGHPVDADYPMCFSNGGSFLLCFHGSCIFGDAEFSETISSLPAIRVVDPFPL